MLMLYVLLSLILAIVYTQFQERTREKITGKQRKRSLAFDHVFDFLGNIVRQQAGGSAGPGGPSTDGDAAMLIVVLSGT